MANQEKSSMEHQKNQKQTRDLQITSIRAVEGEGNERKFVLSFSSEEPYDRWSYTEILDHTNEAVDLSRINEVGCVLYNHNRDIVLGKVIRAWIEKCRGKAEIEFDSDEESEKIYQKVKNKTLKGVSVGYRVLVWEDLTANEMSSDGRFSGPCSIAKKWIPHEISIVSVPADSSVGVGRNLEDDTEERKSLNLCEKQIQINNNNI